MRCAAKINLLCNITYALTRSITWEHTYIYTYGTTRRRQRESYFHSIIIILLLGSA